MMRSRTAQILAVVCVIVLACIGSFFLADYVRDNDAARTLVERFGYLGILIISIIAGLNLFVPIPAATFTPIYVSAGFPLPLIIMTLVIGSTIADSIGYLIGIGGKHITEDAHIKLRQRMEELARLHRKLVLPFVFLFAALSPLPNEIILIPLAIVGIKFHTLFIPLFCGTIVYQTLFAYGMTSTFYYFF